MRDTAQMVLYKRILISSVETASQAMKMRYWIHYHGQLQGQRKFQSQYLMGMDIHVLSSFLVILTKGDNF